MGDCMCLNATWSLCCCRRQSQYYVGVCVNGYHPWWAGGTLVLYMNACGNVKANPNPWKVLNKCSSPLNTWNYHYMLIWNNNNGEMKLQFFSIPTHLPRYDYMYQSLSSIYWSQETEKYCTPSVIYPGSWTWTSNNHLHTITPVFCLDNQQ